MEEKFEKGGALEYLENGIQHPYTEAEKQKVVRKLDAHLLPFCFLLYTFSVLDVSSHLHHHAKEAVIVPMLNHTSDRI